MKWVEGWYVSYALLGASAAGLMPILVPLEVGQKGGAADIGLVMAAFSLGGLTAPLWGGLADRFKLHQWLLIGGLLCTATGAGGFSFASPLSGRIGLALLSGMGLAAASTVANLFIVEIHPQEEWDARIGWLQTFYGGGQVLGLVLAGLIGQSAPGRGLWLAGAASFVAIIPALFARRRDSILFTQPPHVLPHTAHHIEWPVGSPQHLYHHVRLNGLKRIVLEMESPYGLFLTAWLLSFSGSAAFFSLYPVLMDKVYGVLPGLSATGYALAAGLGLILYAPAGRRSGARGALAVLRDALALRIIAFIALTVFATEPIPGRGWFAMLFFLVVVLAWSLLSVSSTALAAALSPRNEGEGIGVFNAVTSFSGVIGAALGGWAAGQWGYDIIPVMGIVGVAAGFLMVISKRFDSKCEEVHQ